MLTEHFECNTLPKWKPMQALKTASNGRKYWNSLKNTSNSDNLLIQSICKSWVMNFGIVLYCIVLYCIMRPYTEGRLYRYRIGIPRELSEIRTQLWLSERSLTCEPSHHR